MLNKLTLALMASLLLSAQATARRNQAATDGSAA